MFEEYLQDASYFFEEGKKEKEVLKSKSYFRCAVFCTSSAMEAFCNYIGETFEHSGTLNEFECAFLNDKEIIFDIRQGEKKEKTRYYSIEDKIKFLVKKFVPSLDISTNKNWTYFIEFKTFRDQLVHPRMTEDEMEIDQYKKIIKTGLTGVIFLINEVLNGVFRKPLRKQILDLTPD